MSIRKLPLLLGLTVLVLVSTTRASVPSPDRNPTMTANQGDFAFSSGSVPAHNDLATFDLGFSDKGVQSLNIVPVHEASTVIAGLLMLLPFGACAIRLMRRRGQLTK